MKEKACKFKKVTFLTADIFIKGTLQIPNQQSLLYLVMGVAKSMHFTT